MSIRMNSQRIRVHIPELSFTTLRWQTDWVKVSCDPQTPDAADRQNWTGELEKTLFRRVTRWAGQTKQVQVRGKPGLIRWQDSVSRSCEVSTRCLLSARRPLTWEAEATTNTLSLPRCRGGFNPSDGSGSGIEGWGGGGFMNERTTILSALAVKETVCAKDSFVSSLHLELSISPFFIYLFIYSFIYLFIYKSVSQCIHWAVSESYCKCNVNNCKQFIQNTRCHFYFSIHQYRGHVE